MGLDRGELSEEEHWFPPLNGLAVFANKHALAQAHACGGGKRKGVGRVAVRQAVGPEEAKPGTK